MNIIDFAVLLILAMYVIYGIHRGAAGSALNTGAFAAASIFSFITYPLVSWLLVKTEFFTFIRYYLEGADYVTNRAMRISEYSSLTAEQMSQTVADANLPYPFSRAVTKNLDKGVFDGSDFTTMGDVFDITLSSVVTNIIAFFILYAVIRIVLTILVNAYCYAVPMPVLTKNDKLIGAGIGLFRGILAMFILFMLVPALLMAMPVQLIVDVVNNSFFCGIFYDSNLLLRLFSGTVLGIL